MASPLARLLAAIATVAAFTAPAHAELKWGDFKDNGCIHPVTHPGLHAKSAVLWGIPPGQSWEETCARTPATVDGISLPHPAVCVNTAISDPLVSGLGLLVSGTACSLVDLVASAAGHDMGNTSDACKRLLERGDEAISLVASGHYARPVEALRRQTQLKWPFRVFGAVLPGEREGWKARVTGLVTKNGVGQVRQNDGGLNIWGVFAVPDEACLPPDYLRLGLANWNAAKTFCGMQGMRLCTRDELCAGGQPVMGAPEGDHWAAVGDRGNAWVSVGTWYPERTCRTHAEALGASPAWGMRLGPQRVTGKPTALRCCR